MFGKLEPPKKTMPVVAKKASPALAKQNVATATKVGKEAAQATLKKVSLGRYLSATSQGIDQSINVIAI